MNTYANLINRKVIVPSQKTNYVAVDLRYFTISHRTEVQKIAFDEAFYLSRYPDIGEAVAAATIVSAAEHYEMMGYYEHRLPYEILVEEDWYLNEYPDIRRAVANGEFTSAQHHFETVGYREGRLPFPQFRLKLDPRAEAQGE